MNRSKGLNLATQKDRSSFFFWPLAVLAGAMLLVPLAAYLSGRFPFGPVQVTDKLILGPEFFIPVYALALFGVQHLMWLCRKPGVQADDPVDLGLSLAPAGLAALWVVAVAGFTVTGKNMLGLTSFEFVVNNVTFELTIWLIFETLLDLKFHFFARPLELTARAKKASAEAVEKLKAPPADDDFMMSLFDAAPDGVNEIGPLRVTYTLKADGTIEDYIDDTDVAETLAKFRSKDPTAATA